MVDKEDQFENWILPDLDESEAETDTDTTLFGKPASWYCSEQELEDAPDGAAEDLPKPLTLDDIEAIRQSAYDDGFKEGKEAGFTQGLKEGNEQGLKEGFEQGTEQGLQDGLAAGKVEIEKQAATWQSLIERLYNPLEQLDENVEYQLVNLATHLAEQIVRSEVLTNPQIILQALKQAVEALPVSEQRLKILLHPDDYKFVQTAYSEEVCLKRGWDLQADPALARGDCQIHTKASSVDYAFSNRIEQVLKHFFKENHEQLPKKNDDSNLLNNDPLKEPATENVSDVTSESESTTQETAEEPLAQDSNKQVS